MVSDCDHGMNWCNDVTLMEILSLSFLDDSETGNNDLLPWWCNSMHIDQCQKSPLGYHSKSTEVKKLHTPTARFKLTILELNRYQDQNVNSWWYWYARVCSGIFFLIHEILCYHYHCPIVFHPWFFFGIVDIHLYHTYVCDFRAPKTKYSWNNLYSDIIWTAFVVWKINFSFEKIWVTRKSALFKNGDASGKTLLIFLMKIRVKMKWMWYVTHPITYLAFYHQI